MWDIWSAACSSGEEAYTIAMILEEAKSQGRVNDYSIMASDISSRVLEQAMRGVYSEERLDKVPREYLSRYFLRSKDRGRGDVRVKPAIRGKISFYRHNLVTDTPASSKLFDLIFCRNALIYFDRCCQQTVLKQLILHLRPGGYLFLGHSESIFGMDLGLLTIGPTIYQKMGGAGI